MTVKQLVVLLEHFSQLFLLVGLVVRAVPQNNSVDTDHFILSIQNGCQDIAFNTIIVILLLLSVLHFQHV